MIARKLRKLKTKGFVFFPIIIGIVYLANDIIYPSYDSLKSEVKEVQTIQRLTMFQSIPFRSQKKTICEMKSAKLMKKNYAT